MLFAEVETEDGQQGLGLSYSKRAGAPGQFAHASEIAPSLLGEDARDIGRLWDLKARRAGELHIHLAAAYPREGWVEHFDWLEPLFNERIEIRGGRMQVPTRRGLGLTLSEQARAWTRDQAHFEHRA